jgi:hypothetical protein
VVFPGGGGPKLVVPNVTPNNGFRGQFKNRGSAAVVGVPIYVGGGGYGYPYDPSFYGGVPPGPQEPQQPNVTVVYPPQPAPVIINQFGPPPDNGATARPRLYEMPQDTQQEQQDTSAAPAVEPTHYLIAFKDHTIYSAIAYWVDGDILHYFTSGNTHNQVSLSLVDRDLTQRLNHESGVQIKLPAVKQ